MRRSPKINKDRITKTLDTVGNLSFANPKLNPMNVRKTI